MNKNIIRITQNVICGIFMLLLITLCVIWTVKGVQSITEKKPPYSYYVYEDMNRLRYHSTRLELVNSIEGYIHKVAPQSCLNGLAILDNCVNYNMDLCFVLAQAQIESEFGTTGLARKTNSVWNVYAFDGLKHEEICDKGKYKYPDESIEPYLKLLQEDYLVNGKTEYDMMHKYINKNGKRYASATDYESKLFNTFKVIKTETKIDSLSQELKKYQLLLGL